MASRLPSVFFACVLPLALAGCSGCQGAKPDADGAGANDYEGDDKGECEDGADNDRDGYFDCQDNGCWGSPVCSGYTGPGPGTGGGAGPGTGGAGTGAGTGSGTGTGTATGVPGCTDDVCDLTSVDITMRMDFDLDGLLVALGLCDCYLEFEGGGTFQDYDPSLERVEFYGDWVRTDPGLYGTTTTPTGTGSATGTGTGTGSGTGTGTGFFESCDPYIIRPCEPFIANGIWWTNNPVYHSLFFDSGASPTSVEDWSTYEFPGAYAPGADPNQFYVTNLFADYDHAQADPFVESLVIENDPYGQFTVYITWEATFHK